jgi:N-acetylglucosamine-6-sulfatase
MNHPSRRAFLRTSVIGSAAGLGFQGLAALAAESAPSATRPNILFIFSDDHACNAIGAYGSRINKTPNIDRIALEGAVFLNNTCCNSICAPSRAAVLTGKHSHANGQMTNAETFDGSQPTFPKLLQQAGYETALIGKWHLRSDPTGFDYWDVLPGQGDYYNPEFISQEGKRTVYGYNTDVVTDLSIRWMQEQRDPEKPFLLMCQYKAPHRTWMPNIEHLDLYEDEDIPEPTTLFDDYTGRAGSIAKNEMTIAEHLLMGYDLNVLPPEEGRDADLFPNTSYDKMSPAQKAAWDAAFEPRNEAFKAANLQGEELVHWKYQRYIKNYLRCIASIDDNIGRLLDYLEWSGQLDNTIVVYSSDQGFYLGEHGMFDKRWMYEESLKMPLVVRWPGTIEPGTKIDALSQNIDFAPTFLEAAGVTPPAEMQGMSMVPLMRDPKAPWREAIYYHYYEEGEHNVARHEGVRIARYKLIHFYDTGEWEFYDLEQDPHEMQSRYNEPAYAEEVQRLKVVLASLREKYEVPG